MLIVDPSAARGWFGFGVAGNFAGHLEQAGEAADFVNVDGEGEAPKGIFPFYVPGAGTFLGTFPLSSNAIALPGDAAGANLQIEPEAGLVCDIGYAADSSVASLSPVAVGAFNDCSIRRPGARKISEKKNWGPDSKGLASELLPVADIEPDGGVANLRIASFLRRGGETHAYGLDSPMAGYSYCGRRLLDWMVERLNGQEDSPLTPLEDLGACLRDAGNPARAVIGIGATRYTEFGASNFLTDGDESIVIVYDSREHTPEDVEATVRRRGESELSAASVLCQTVHAAT
ncbi:MAG: hypothetical protein HZB14_06205 [Actinobacteria bacterium]|nr:hypothetical protein [Actinomycetota bacterium]